MAQKEASGDMRKSRLASGQRSIGRAPLCAGDLSSLATLALVTDLGGIFTPSVHFSSSCLFAEPPDRSYFIGIDELFTALFVQIWEEQPDSSNVECR